MKVMVIDTVGGNRFSSAYKAYFPNINLRGLEMHDMGPCQAHGYQCGYYAGVLLNTIPGKHEIVYVRNFDGDGNWISGCEQWMLEMIEREAPDYITRSWGQDDGDSAFGDKVASSGWKQWVMYFRALQKKHGFVDFGAAGNGDFNDLDNDISYPQRLMTDITNVIGSHRKDGIPSTFSGDGVGVQCVLWGEDILLNDNGKWGIGSGTSFSCPKAAGLCAALGLNSDEWRKYVVNNTTKPEDWKGKLPHPKWGFGSLEYRYQEYLARLDEHLLPPHIRSARISTLPRWFDRKLVKSKAKRAIRSKK